MPLNSTVTIACAGAGKTTGLIENAFAINPKRSLVTTYTTNNTDELEGRVASGAGKHEALPEVMSWFTFLLQDLVRPYQNYLLSERIEGLHFIEGRSAKFAKKTDARRYYTNASHQIYSDKLSEFAIACNAASGGKPIARLRRLYDRIYIDEVQDMAGHDLELIELLLRSGFTLTMVGDPRQSTYSTTNSAKNSAYRKALIVNKFREWEKNGLIGINEENESRRCCEQVCDFASALFPEFPPMISKRTDSNPHSGIWIVKTTDAPEYMREFRPTVLRYDRRTDCLGLEAGNFGVAKGKTFPRVLIFPNGPIGKMLQTGDLKHVEKSIQKFYVAITRAEWSVAFVHDTECALGSAKLWET
jgi:DNA helicase II / ATP-dependent DNA helicase PcrA